MASSMKRQLDSNASAFDPSLKRARSSQPQTRVVFVRGLPSDCLESELLALCCPFAVVEKCVLVPLKCQAFVQLPDAASAANLIAFYQTRDALIRGKKILFEHSTRDELTIRPSYDDPRTRAPAAAASAPSQYQAPYVPSPRQQQQQLPPQRQPDPRGPPPTYYNEPAGGPPVHSTATTSVLPHGGPGVPNAILLVTVTKIEYDVTVDVLEQVFQKFGAVQKIATYWQSNEFKALVQMATTAQAQAAQAALDGRDIYTGCNQLAIAFSRHTELHVRFNNERSRDFTNPYLTAGDGSDIHDAHEFYKEPTAMFVPPPSAAVAMAPAMPSATSRTIDDRGRSEREYGRPGPSGRDNYDPRDAGRSSRSDFGRDDAYRSESRYHDNRGPPPPSRYGDSRSGGRSGPDDRMMRESRGVPVSAAGPLPSHSTGRSLHTEDSRSAVLICSSIDRELMTPERLFTFFGCYGDVERVKIMFRKQGTALIQFVNDVHATSALDHLDGVVVFGKKLRVDYSKHTSVSMPHGQVDQFELDNTRDFSNSPLHRYRRRSTQEAVSPVPLLHVSGIPLAFQRDRGALVDTFAQFGYVKSFRYLQKNNKMALVEMGSLDEAVLALLHLDNLTHPDSHMRVSFSKAFPFTETAAAMAAAGVGADGYSSSGPPPPMRAPRDRSRSRSRSRERPGGMRMDMRHRENGGGDYRDRGFPRDSRDNRGGRPGDSYRRPPPQRY